MTVSDNFKFGKKAASLLKKALKVTGVLLGSLILFIGLYLIAAYSFSRIEVGEQKDKEEITIYILSNGVHTDIVVPIKTDELDWSKSIRFAHTVANDTLANWLAFGWGDKGFYLETPTWADLKISTAFKAAFALSSSAIHTTFYKRLSEDEQCKRISISKAQYVKLVDYIKKSLLLDKHGKVIPIKTNANYGKNDAFYEAIGSYSFFHTCNTWANNALKACGQKACLWTPFDTGIFYHYR